MLPKPEEKNTSNGLFRTHLTYNLRMLEPTEKKKKRKKKEKKERKKERKKNKKEKQNKTKQNKTKLGLIQNYFSR